MRLEEIADIKQGITLSRIRIRDHMEIESRTVYSFEEESEIKVPKNIEKIDQNIPLVVENMIIFNIISYNAKIATKEDLGKIVPSNYMIITINNKDIDPDYLAWFMDQSESFKRELYKIIQGTTVRSIPINEFRKVRVKLPNLAFQEKIGSISKLNQKKKMLFIEKQNLICKSLITINEGEILNG